MPPLTPLVRPDRHFAEREAAHLLLFAVVVVLVLAIGPLVLYGAGFVLTAHFDGTAEVDNPERPPDGFCETDFDTLDQSGCDQPRTVERDVDSVLWSAIDGLATGPALLAGPLVLVATGVLLHAGSWLAGGDGDVGASFAVAAWGWFPCSQAASSGWSSSTSRWTR